jgi:hypothetical protein
MSFDDLDAKPLPLRGKWYTSNDFGRDYSRDFPAETNPPRTPLPPMTNIEMSVRTGIDFYITDKLSCARGEEEATLLLLCERVLNMVRSRHGLRPLSVYTVNPDNPFDRDTPTDDTPTDDTTDGNDGSQETA